MKIRYDQRLDALTVVFKEQSEITVSDDGKPGAILDFDRAGDLVAIEILGASCRVSEPTLLDFAVSKD